MRNLKYIAIILAVAPLASCATGAQVQYNSDVMVIKKAAIAFKACEASVAYLPQYIPLKSHMRVSPRSANVTEFADNSMISTEDASLITEYQTSMGNCERQFAGQISSVSQRLGQIVMAAHAAHDENTADLIDHKETWGQYNKRRQYIASAASKEMINASDQITSNLNQENQFEIQQREQAFANFQRAMQTQEIINSFNQPRITTCNKFGLTTSCTTQ
jgi:hypothetical protein